MKTDSKPHPVIRGLLPKIDRLRAPRSASGTCPHLTPLLFKCCLVSVARISPGHDRVLPLIGIAGATRLSKLVLRRFLPAGGVSGAFQAQCGPVAVDGDLADGLQAVGWGEGADDVAVQVGGQWEGELGIGDPEDRAGACCGEDGGERCLEVGEIGGGEEDDVGLGDFGAGCGGADGLVDGRGRAGKGHASVALDLQPLGERFF